MVVRRFQVLLAAVTALGLAACLQNSASLNANQALLELDAPTLAAELAAGRLSAEALTRASLERIQSIDVDGPALKAVIEVNPDAISVAKDLDQRFRDGGAIGLLHGVPVLLKANIDTADRMATSAGSIALAEHHASSDATIVVRLRDAGAVIVGKTNLSEWANFRDLDSTSGWSSLGGQTRNPYVLDRNPCGSSSGSAVAVAARLAPLAVGTETSGSVACPAGANGIVGIKPTAGLLEQGGIIPVAASFDTAGPMARTVRGAALLLAALQSPVDAARTLPARSAALAAAPESIARPLTGLRLGAVRDYAGAGSLSELDRAYGQWLDALQGLGAEIVDPIRVDMQAGARAAALEVMLYEFKTGINAYLENTSSGPNSLADLIDFNNENASVVMPHFGQGLLTVANVRGDLDDPNYLRAMRASRDALRDRLDKLFTDHELHALVAPANGPAWKTDWVNGDRFSVSSSSLAAISGRPSIVVPAAVLNDLPVGIAFVGQMFEEALLIEIGAAFEKTRGPIPEPTFTPSVD